MPKSRSTRIVSTFFAILLSCLAAFASPDQPTPNVPQAPVLVDGKPIFQVSGVLSFSAQGRADAITRRIKDLSEDLTTSPSSITVSDAENTSAIVSGDLVLMSVVDQDARLAGKPRPALAQDYAKRISTSLTLLRKQYSAKTITLGALYALLTTVALVLLFTLFSNLFPRLYRKFDSWRDTVIPSLRIQNFELLPSGRITDSLIGLARLLRLALTLIALYFYIYLLLGFFPWTRPYAGVLVGYILTPLHTLGRTLLAYLPNFFYIAIIIVIARYCIKFIHIFFIELAKGSVAFSGFHREWAAPTYKIIRFMILAITAIAAFPYLPGAKSPAFQGISIFLGVLLSLGSSSAVSNIVAGVILTYMRAFKLDDRVQIADTVGDVIEVSLLVTRIRTIKNVEVTIANSMVLSSHIVNFSSEKSEQGLILHTSVTIGYDAPWRTIHQLLTSAAAATPGILETPAPFVLQTALDDFYVHYQINAYTNQPHQMARLYSDLHQNIQDTFFAAGVEIMSSHYSTIREGNRVAIPDQYLPKDYKAPSFRVDIQKDFGGPDSVK
jgi:small-conductance mechanosensitive channel